MFRCLKENDFTEQWVDLLPLAAPPGTGILAEADCGDSGTAQQPSGGPDFSSVDVYRRFASGITARNLRKMLGLVGPRQQNAGKFKSLVLESEGSALSRMWTIAL